ncbi:MAG: hypothetical protein KDA29_06030 [Phycisphaerales bacterium]|nr:hypothetical protein [Phycisphaerales bacterium]
MTSHAELNGNSVHHETADMIGHPHETYDDATELDHETLDPESVKEISPEGRPAHPELNSKSMIMLMFGSIGVFMLVSFVVFLFYGVAPAAIILIFGTAVCCVGNPVIWSIPLRAKERDELEHPEHG